MPAKDFFQRDPLSEDAIVSCTWPYRNDRIIDVIKDLFFVGGISSFAHRFDSHFPTVEGNDGVMRHEVPIPMVALVAMVVSANICCMMFC